MSDYILDENDVNYKETVKRIVSTTTELSEKIVLAGSIAYHQLGEISREWGLEVPYKYETPEYIVVTGESEHYYVGSWIEGYGFFNVLFPKKTVRELTDSEMAYFKNLRFGIK